MSEQFARSVWAPVDPGVPDPAETLDFSGVPAALGARVDAVLDTIPSLSYNNHPVQITAAKPTPMTITIPGADGTPLVSIRPSGELEYGPNYTPDEAARLFWEALASHRGEAHVELARLRQGEEPVPPNRIPHRPGQWITLWNAQTPAERLAHAQRILDCSLACGQLQEKADYYRQQLKAAEDELAEWRQRAAAPPVETRHLGDANTTAEVAS